MGISKEDFEKLTPEEQQAYIEMIAPPPPSEQMRKRAWVTQEWPERPAQWVAALLGLPVERKPRPIRHPITIFSHIVVFVVVLWLQLRVGMGDSVQGLGFIPSEFYRGFFVTLVTSFFMHGGVMHALGNAYYFYIFGDDVEDDLGPVRFLGLLYGGHLLGMVAHGFLGGVPGVPTVGASAGISALMGYYMIRFPSRQISYMVFFFYYWIHIPAMLAFCWKFGWEFWLATSMNGTHSGVALWAHLGGAAFGVVVALLNHQPERIQRQSSLQSPSAQESPRNDS